MYRYCIAAAITSIAICASELSQHHITRKLIEKTACEKPVQELHQLLTTSSQSYLEIINRAEYKDMQPFLLFACIPKELRMYTLTHNFFHYDDNNDNNNAAEIFEQKPYTTSLWLLAEYQQKPHPYQHLLPKYIFLLRPEQVIAVTEIEYQPTFPKPAAIQSFGFLPPQDFYAHVSHEHKKILETLPDYVIEQSILNNKSIVYKEDYIESLNLIKDIISSCIKLPQNHVALGIIAGIVKLGWHAMKVNNYASVSMLTDVILLGLLKQHNRPPHTIFPSWITSRTALDIIGISYAFYYKKYALASTIFNYSMVPPLFIGMATMSAIIWLDRCTASYPSQFILHSKRKNDVQIAPYCKKKC